MMQMTATKRPAQERGHTQLEWLDSWHSFSFGDYFDPAHHSFRTLRVINDDLVGPGRGFPEHPHRNMEILTYVISGQLSHRDSMGHTRTVGPGQVQYMSAGAGVSHSEFNASPTQPVHFLQIWMMPHANGLRPGYAEWSESPGPLVLIASPEERKGSLTLRQDASIYLGKLGEGESVAHATQSDRGLWLQIISGELEVNGETLQPGDGLAMEGILSCELVARAAAQFLLFDLA
jgi:redox-sensitive bicupin YhaK (pirin superfamily)